MRGATFGLKNAERVRHGRGVSSTLAKVGNFNQIRFVRRSRAARREEP